MNREQAIREIEKWSNLRAISGYEDKASAKLAESIRNLNCTVEIDNLYNVICVKKGIGSSRRIMIIAHLDEVGIQIICKKNQRAKRYLFKTLGSIRNSNLINESVCFENGIAGKI